MKKFLLGEPYIIECSCGQEILTSVTFGSGGYTCPKCGDTGRFDYVSKEELKNNQEKYKDLIRDLLEEGD